MGTKGRGAMRRRTFFVYMMLTAVLSVGATLAALGFLNPGSQAEPITHVATFVVVHSPTPDPNATIPVRIITATLLPGQVAGIPTDLLETPNLTTSPVPTLDPNIIQTAGPQAAGTITALPQNCILHVVEEGDTPFGIAELYGADGFRLMAVNGLTEETATLMQVGDVLIVPLEGCPLEATPVAEESPTRTPRGGATEEATEEVTLTPSPSPTITLAPTASNAQLEIVEVVSAGDVTAEAVRIHNPGRAVDVTGWTLSDSEGNEFVFPQQLLFSNAGITVYTRSGENTPVALFWGRDEAVWGERGEVLTLRDADGRVQATLRLP